MSSVLAVAFLACACITAACVVLLLLLITDLRKRSERGSSADLLAQLDDARKTLADQSSQYDGIESEVVRITVHQSVDQLLHRGPIPDKVIKRALDRRSNVEENR